MSLPGASIGPRGSGRQASGASADFTRSAIRVLRRMGPDAWLLLAVALLGAGSVLLSVLAPIALADATNLIFDAFVTGEALEIDALARTLSTALAMYVGSSSLLWLHGYLLAGAVQRMVFRLREAVEDKLHRLPLTYVDRTTRGELLSRVTNDIDNVAQSLQNTVGQALIAAFTLVGVSTMMLIVSPPLAAVALVTIPLAAAITVTVGRRSRRLFVQQWTQIGHLNEQVEEAVSGHAVVSLFGRRRHVEARFDETAQRVFDASSKAQFVSGLIVPLVIFIGNLVYVLIAVLGGLLVAGGSLRIGDVQALIQYSQQLSQPIAQLGSIVNMFQSGVASAERVFELLDADTEPDETALCDPSPAEITGRVTFDDVSFGYEPEHPLLRSLSFTAEPGHTVAIVGPSGAGKTTLVNLLMRFYDVDAGSIDLDGRNVTSMSRGSLRSRMGMVLQDTWLFDGTIRENIMYGNPSASAEEFLAAAAAARVDTFVHSLPEGFETAMRENGANISAGERQLITIARAFLANPRILILDEATSAVDTRTEVLVQTAMRRLRTDRTSFVIAHRLSTIRDADLILVMEAGTVVERGTHAELVAAQGLYARLHGAQSGA